MHDWVGDLSLGAKWMTKMKAENTIHCLGPEMPALFHVELLPYRYNPFPAAHGFQPGSLPWRSGRCLKNSCQGVPDEVSFAPGQGRSSGVTVVQCHRTSSLVQRCKSTQSWALSSLAVEKFFHQIIILTAFTRTGPGPLQQTAPVAAFGKSRMWHR